MVLQVGPGESVCLANGLIAEVMVRFTAFTGTLRAGMA
jgi:hypothetical protein